MRLFLAAVALAGLVGVASHHETAIAPREGAHVIRAKVSDGDAAGPVATRPAAPSKPGAIPAW